MGDKRSNCVYWKVSVKNVFTSRIAFSHFSYNVVPWYTTVSKKIVSLSDISALNFVVG